MKPKVFAWRSKTSFYLLPQIEYCWGILRSEKHIYLAWLCWVVDIEIETSDHFYKPEEEGDWQ